MAPLTTLKNGTSSTIDKIDESISGEQRRRLLDLGIYPGAKITHCFSSVTGEPIAYEILGSVIALRKEQTDKIYTSDN
jgi:DtxR family Mn-dependent transcriptional regulator|tara:strand:- start:86 stop:319 length:234 start_codon:yes stop_codon:yes gene_type:complete